MSRKTLARHQLAGAGWSHPYPIHPFAPTFYADGGDGGDSGSGSGDEGAGDGGTDGSSSGDSDTGGDNAGAGAKTGSGKGASGQGKSEEDPAATIRRLERELHTARSEAGKARNAAKQQAADDAVKDLTQKLGRALGLVKDDTPPDPQKLAEAIAQKDTTIAERDSAIRAKDVELAVWARADKAHAKAGALLDSRSFLRAIADLDPSEKGFTTALDEAIKAAVKENPNFAATAPAGKSGGDLSGGTGEGAARRNGSLAGAIKNHYGN